MEQKLIFGPPAQTQAIACTQIFFHGIEVDPKDFQKYHRNLSASDGQRRYPGSKFGTFFQNLLFWARYLVNKKSKDILIKFVG